MIDHPTKYFASLDIDGEVRMHSSKHKLIKNQRYLKINILEQNSKLKVCVRKRKEVIN